jgi:tetratricopeptide (TPR) repeat protein
LAARALVAATLASPAALADPRSAVDGQIAQSLFDDARALVEAGRYAEACPKFAESQRLDPAGGTLLNLANCHELQGRTATAWTQFNDALSQAIRDGRKDREAFAREHLAALAPRLVRIVVVVPERLAASGAAVFLDGSELPRAAWDSAIPVDPGAHAVTVGAWTRTIVADEPGRTYRVEVPSPDAQPAGAEPTAREKSRLSTGSYVLLVSGGALLATSAVTGLLALRDDAYVAASCSAARDFCRNADAADVASRARTLAWFSTATLVAGAGALVGAFLLPRTRVAVSFANGGAMATLRLAVP